MASSTTAAPMPRNEFERQRGELLREIADSFEQVLAGINKLNRNLEAVITVGNEFSSVEALWSTFENVMGKPEGEEEGAEEGAAVSGGEEKTAGNRKDARSANQQEERHEEAGAYGEEEEEEL